MECVILGKATAYFAKQRNLDKLVLGDRDDLENRLQDNTVVTNLAK